MLSMSKAMIILYYIIHNYRNFLLLNHNAADKNVRILHNNKDNLLNKKYFAHF